MWFRSLGGPGSRVRRFLSGFGINRGRGSRAEGDESYMGCLIANEISFLLALLLYGFEAKPGRRSGGQDQCTFGHQDYRRPPRRSHVIFDTAGSRMDRIRLARKLEMTCLYPKNPSQIRRFKLRRSLKSPLYSTHWTDPIVCQPQGI